MVSLHIPDLEVRYGGHVALDRVHLDVSAPASLAVIGPNGSGKSTFLSAIAGLTTPTRGTVTTTSRTEPAMVLQATNVDRSLPITVQDTVGLARLPRLGLWRRRSPEDRARTLAALERLDVDDLATRQLHELSGGQRQRVLVAQGLAQESEILLLDEPVTGLDVVTRELILDVVQDERDAGRLVVMTTHSLDDAQRCDRVLLLATSQVAFGTPSEVLTTNHLRQAFGRRIVQLDDGLLLSEGIHHDHD